ncbi:MAG: hypothetical protein MUC72_00340 [Acidobacteria bacterium]|nr:hypothetical protein [Acidobacteriota bacterium]
MVKKLVILAGIFLLVQAVLGQSLQRGNFLPRVEKAADQVVIRITPPQQQGIYFIHYRTDGVEGFQVRKMQADAAGVFLCRIPTGNLYGRNIEYFVAEKRGGKMVPVSLTHTVPGFTREKSPEIYFQSGESPTAPRRKPELPFNVNASLSTSTKLDEENDSGYYQQNYTANGNLRIYKNIVKNNYQLDLDTNFVHIDPYETKETRINLSSMMVRFKKGGMQIEAGDVAVNETEFTTSYLNRRGLRLEYVGKSLYMNSFYANSQQKTGFDGYGVPDAAAGIFGAVAGIKLKNTFKLRGMFMTGKDNLDSKTVSYSQNPYRAGDVFSLWGELSLLKNRLQLAGEISSSNYAAGEDEAALNKESDTAWKAGLKYNHGILSFAADYEEIGDRFNSIANLFLQNDREGLSSNLGLNIKSFSWNVTYVDKKNYLHSLVQDALHQKRIGTTFNWGLGSHFRIGADLSRDNLDYDSSTGLQTSSSDMNTNSYSASFGYIAGSNGININVGRTESLKFTANLNASLALNLRFGRFMSLNPTLSYQENENLCDGSKSTIYNLYLNSEITFIPQYLSLTISSSYMNNDNPYGTSANWTAGCNLNFFAAKLFKDKIRPSLSLKSMFQGAKYGDTKTNASIFHLQADIAF